MNPTYGKRAGQYNKEKIKGEIRCHTICGAKHPSQHQHEMQVHA